MKKLLYLLPFISILVPTRIEHSEREHINSSIEMKEIILNTEFAWEKEIDSVFIYSEIDQDEIRYFLENEGEEEKYKELSKIFEHEINKPIYRVYDINHCNLIIK